MHEQEQHAIAELLERDESMQQEIRDLRTTLATTQEDLRKSRTSEAQLKKAHKIQCRARSRGLKRRLSTPTIFEIYLISM